VEPQSPTDVVVDTSVLINFLNVDRLDLFASHPHYRFLVTEHVKREVTEHYPHQINRLNDGLVSGALSEIVVNSLPELATFAELSASGRLGWGECAAIAAAKHQGLMLAIDDKQAKKTAHRLCKPHTVIDTVELMILFIQEKLIDITQADLIKQDWQDQFRFRLTFTSFSEKV
jgi:predicted nucleic acid-binding protein